MSRIDSLAVLIASWDGRAHLETCLASLEAVEDPGVPWEILVFDNGSADGTGAWLAARHPRVRVVRSESNLGFAVAVNRLAEACRADGLVLLNNDTRVDPGWLRALRGRLEDSPVEVAAVAGLILDWEGARLDFAGGVMTFDAHAFQTNYHHPLAGARLPPAGSDLFFPCGGNLLVTRRAFLEVGGFDPAYFAYFEDVDLGWRLRAAGLRVVFEPSARIRHRSMATSARLGTHRRGFLFERNALRTAAKNLDTAHWPALMPAVLLTFLSRTLAIMVEGNPGGARLVHDPYRDGTPQPPPPGPAPAGPLDRLYSLLGGAPRPAMSLDDPRSLLQLQAAASLLGGLDGLAEARARTQALRRVPDAALFAAFPLYLVPTYPGDAALFAAPGFRTWLPAGLPLVEARLEDFVAP